MCASRSFRCPCRCDGCCSCGGVARESEWQGAFIRDVFLEHSADTSERLVLARPERVCPLQNIANNTLPLFFFQYVPCKAEVKYRANLPSSSCCKCVESSSKLFGELAANENDCSDDACGCCGVRSRKTTIKPLCIVTLNPLSNRPVHFAR